MSEFLAKTKRLKFKNREGVDVDLVGLFPIDKEQQAKLKTLKSDEIVTVEFRRFRTKNHLDQAFAVSFFLWENWRDKGHYPTANVFRDFLSIELGFCYPVYRAGSVLLIPETWSYKTEQSEFMERLYNPLMKFASEYLDYKDRSALIVDSIKAKTNNH